MAWCDGPGRRREARRGAITLHPLVQRAITAYLADERRLARIAGDADIESLTLSLVGGGHLLFADHESGQATTVDVGKLVAAVLADALQRRPR